MKAIVMKFGGSSLESAFAIRKICSIVEGQLSRNPVVVVSAIGKTTNRLVELEQLRAAGDITGLSRAFEHLNRFHILLATAVSSGPLQNQLLADVAALFVQLKQCLESTGPTTGEHSDGILSFGERLSSLIVTAALRQRALKAVHLDALRAVVTDDRFTEAEPLLIETNALLRRLVRQDEITVMGGFIGATEDGRTTTLGRGGSDYTAAIVGGAICADKIQIWTDVDGMLTCDPRMVADGHCLRTLSYLEAEEMAKAGAKVLHPATVAPAIRQRVPIVIRNSRNPNNPGTRIQPAPPADGVVMSIACKSDLTLLNIVRRISPNTPDFADRLWSVFTLHHAEFQIVSASHKCFSVILEKSKLTPELLHVLNQNACVDVIPQRSVVTLIGHRAGLNPKNFLQAAQLVHQTTVDALSMPLQGNRFGFVVPEADVTRVARLLHAEFFAKPDPELFQCSRFRTIEDVNLPRLHAPQTILAS